MSILADIGQLLAWLVQTLTSATPISLPLEEESRIFRAGGWVEFNRVNGKNEPCIKFNYSMQFVYSNWLPEAVSL